MTDEPSVDPGEDDVRRILGSADRPRALRDDELTRLRSKVEGLAAPMSPAAPPDHVEVRSHAAAPAPASARSRLVAIAVAAAVVVIGLVVFSGGGEDTNEVEVAGDPEALVQTPLEQTCTREIARLASAIDAWDGIGNWALTQTGEPALDTLASDALLALARIEGLEADAATALGDLDADLAAASELLQAPARAARTEAVTAAAEAIVGLVESHPGGAGCDLARLRAGLER